jgi:PHD/YefM family antitoxin component YafN of YafNO toxin-antitoxin module
VGLQLGYKSLSPRGSNSLSDQIESDSVTIMKTLSVTEVARNFSAVVDTVERDQEEIVLVRNRRQVARLVPEAPRQDAMEVFGDLYRTLDEKAAKALSDAVSSGRKGRRGRVSELKNPWAG